MVVVTKSEILFLKNKSNDYITYYLCEYINCINDNRNILYITYNYFKKVLLSKYNVVFIIVINDRMEMKKNDKESYITTRWGRNLYH